MRSLVVVMLAIPLTAAVTAGTTVLALKHLNTKWPVTVPAPVQRAPSSTDDHAPAPSEPVTPPREAATDVGEPAITLVSAPMSRVEPGLGANAASGSPAASDPLDDASAETPDPENVASAEVDAPADERIDFVKLSDELDEISNRLERFNRKLLEVIAENESSEPVVAADPAESAEPAQEDEG